MHKQWAINNILRASCIILIHDVLASSCAFNISCTRYTPKTWGVHQRIAPPTSNPPENLALESRAGTLRELVLSPRQLQLRRLKLCCPGTPAVPIFKFGLARRASLACRTPYLLHPLAHLRLRLCMQPRSFCAPKSRFRFAIVSRSLHPSTVKPYRAGA